MPGRILTVEFDGAPAERDASVTAQELQASLRRVSGVEVEITAVRRAATRWTDNARQVTDYRSGRVLLACDAAHVHSPFSAVERWVDPARAGERSRRRQDLAAVTA